MFAQRIFFKALLQFQHRQHSAEDEIDIGFSSWATSSRKLQTPVNWNF